MAEDRNARQKKESSVEKELFALEKALSLKSKPQLLRACKDLDVQVDVNASATEIRAEILREARRRATRPGAVGHQNPDPILQLAVALAKADKQFTSEEVEEIHKAAGRDLAGLSNHSRSELEESVSLLRHADIDVHLITKELKDSLNQAEIESLMDYLIDIAVSDGVFHPQEEQLLRSIQIAIGSDSKRFERQLKLCKVIAKSNDENRVERQAESSTQQQNLQALTSSKSAQESEINYSPRWEVNRSQDLKESTKRKAPQSTSTTPSALNKENKARSSDREYDEKRQSPSLEISANDSIWMLHPPKALHSTIQWVGLKTIGELLDLDIAESRLDPSGQKAREIEKLRERAQNLVSQIKDQSSNSAKAQRTPRNIDTLFTLLKRRQ